MGREGKRNEAPVDENKHFPKQYQTDKGCNVFVSPLLTLKTKEEFFVYFLQQAVYKHMTTSWLTGHNKHFMVSYGKLNMGSIWAKSNISDH